MKTAMRAGSYLDTSFLFKLYLVEPDSEDAVMWLQQNRRHLYVSSLTDIEVITSFYRQDSFVVGMRAVDSYLEDLTANIYVKLEMDAEVFSRAVDIAERHSREYKLRSLDILHLATAVRHGVSVFGTYDNRLRDAAVAMGLQVLPERS